MYSHKQSNRRADKSGIGINTVAANADRKTELGIHQTQIKKRMTQAQL